MRTVAWYDATLNRQFLPWCADEGVTDPGDLTPQVVGRFTARLIERQGVHGSLSRSTVRSYVRAVRVFLARAKAPEGGAADVGASPRLPRPEQKVLDVLTREEIQAMENAAKAERDKLIVRVLADCGLRLVEVLALRAEDLRESRRAELALNVRGKGSRNRVVPLAPRPYRRLRRYLGASGAERRDPIFVALRKGTDGAYPPLTKRGLEQTIRAIAREVGIEKRVYPHVLRHSFATK